MTKKDLSFQYFQTLHKLLKIKIPFEVDINFPQASNHVVLLITVVASQASRDQVTASIKQQVIKQGLITPLKVKTNPDLLRQILKPSGNVERKIKTIFQAIDQIFYDCILNLEQMHSKKLYGLGLKSKAIITSCIIGKKTTFVDINVLRAFRSYSKFNISADDLHRNIEKLYPKQGPELTYRLWFYRKKYCKRIHCDFSVQCVKCIDFWT